MTKHTRYFISAAAVIVVAGLGIVLVAYYSGGLPLMASRQSANEDLAYLPSDSTVVAYANVRDIMNSQFRQRLREVMPNVTGEGRNEFLDETGIDLEHEKTGVLPSQQWKRERFKRNRAAQKWVGGDTLKARAVYEWGLGKKIMIAMIQGYVVSFLNIILIY